MLTMEDEVAVKWMGTIPCRWCGKDARAGIEKDSKGSTYRAICDWCGINEQAGIAFPAGKKITELLGAPKPESTEWTARGQGKGVRELQAR